MVSEIALDPVALVGIVIALIVFALGVARSYYLLRGEIREVNSRMNYMSDDLASIKSVLMEKALSYSLKSEVAVKNSPVLPAGELATVELSQETLRVITEGLKKIHQVYNLNRTDDDGILGHMELMILQMIKKEEIPQEDLDKMAKIMQDIGYDRSSERLITLDSHIPAILLAIKAKSLIDLDEIKKGPSLSE